MYQGDRLTRQSGKWPKYETRIRATPGNEGAASMPIRPRLIVTGRDADGTSLFVTDKPVDPIEVDALPGSEVYLLWGTEDGAPAVGTGPRQPKHLPYFPAPAEPGSCSIVSPLTPRRPSPPATRAHRPPKSPRSSPACSMCPSRTTPACTPPTRWTTESAWKARCTWNWTTARRSG